MSHAKMAIGYTSRMLEIIFITYAICVTGKLKIEIKKYIDVINVIMIYKLNTFSTQSINTGYFLVNL